MRNRLLMAGLFVLCVAAGKTSAAVFCAATSSAIRQALVIAGSNGEADTIRIVIGTYSASTGATAFPYSTNENRALTIEGGYTFGCGVRMDKANLTVLSGSGVRQVMRLSASGSGAITVRNLTLEDGNAAVAGAGLSIVGPGNPFLPLFKGTVVVERVILWANRSDASAGGLAVSTSDGSIVLRGNLFAFNRCSESHCSLTVESNASDADPILVYFGGNTVALNTCNLGAPQCSTGGARFSGAQHAVIYDNLFAFHSGEDLLLESPAVDADLYDNNVELIGGTPSSEIGTLTISDPQFVDALAEDFRLRATSPMRNQGTAPFPLPGIDLDGNPRIVESAPDLGAYESPDYLFTDGFEFSPPGRMQFPDANPEKIPVSNSCRSSPGAVCR